MQQAGWLCAFPSFSLWVKPAYPRRFSLSHTLTGDQAPGLAWVQALTSPPILPSTSLPGVELSTMGSHPQSLSGSSKRKKPFRPPKIEDGVNGRFGGAGRGTKFRSTGILVCVGSFTGDLKNSVVPYFVFLQWIYPFLFRLRYQCRC
jgi:hypothetical protein